MARVEPPKRTDTCPGCSGERYLRVFGETASRRSRCTYCDGHGRVTNHKYKTLLAYFRSEPGARKRLATGESIH